MGNRKIYFPLVNRNMLYFSFFSALLLLILLSSKFFQYSLPHNIFINRLTYILDPLILQLFSFLLLIILAFKFIYKPDKNEIAHKTSFLYYVLFLFILLFSEIILEFFVLKPSFHFNRPAKSMEESFFINFLIHNKLIKNFISGKNGSSAPSGFTLRQIFIFYSYLILHIQNNKSINFKRIKNITISLYSILMVIICLSRIYRNAHSFFDIGLGIGIGTLIFWFIYIAFLKLLKLDHIPKNDLTGDFILPGISLCFTILLFCQRTELWLGFSLSIFVLLGLIDVIKIKKVL